MQGVGKVALVGQDPGTILAGGDSVCVADHDEERPLQWSQNSPEWIY